MSRYEHGIIRGITQRLWRSFKRCAIINKRFPKERGGEGEGDKEREREREREKKRNQDTNTRK